MSKVTTKQITVKKSYDELMGIHQGYIKMIEVLTAKNTTQMRVIKDEGKYHKNGNTKEYAIK